MNHYDTIVIGAGNSGTQIAMELAATRRVWLSGRDTGAIPRRLLGRDIYRWLWPDDKRFRLIGALAPRLLRLRAASLVRHSAGRQTSHPHERGAQDASRIAFYF